MPRTSRTFAFGTLLASLTVCAVAGCGRKDGNETSTPNVAIAPDQQVVEGRGGDPERIQSVDQLRQIGLAWLNFPEANIHYPYPGSKDPKYASAGLSWRVMILPYIEESALYNEFRLNEPWDSEHNKKLIAKMPALYASGGLKREDGKTRYRALAGPNCGVPVATPNGPHPTPRKPSDVSDGAANTLAVVEADEAVIWTKPDEVRLDQPRAKLFQWKDGTVLTLFLDGEVRTAPAAKLTDDIFRRYATHNGGEALDGADVWTVIPRRPRTAEEQKADEEWEARRVVMEKKLEAQRNALAADYDKWFAEYTRASDALNLERAKSIALREDTRRQIAAATRDIEFYNAEGAKIRSEQQFVTGEIKKYTEQIELDTAKLKAQEPVLTAATGATTIARERADRTKRAVTEAKAAFDDLAKKRIDEKDAAAQQLLAKKLRVADEQLKDLTTLDTAARSEREDCEKKLAPLTDTKNKLLKAVQDNKVHIEIARTELERLRVPERVLAKVQAARTQVSEYELALKKLDARDPVIDAELKAVEAKWAERRKEYERRVKAMHDEVEALFPPDKK